MVNSQDATLDRTFAALADPTRRAMVERLALGERSVADLSEPFGISAPAISKHLRVLERAGLLRQRKEGRYRRCSLIGEPLRDAALWVEQYRAFWTEQLDSLASYLEQEPGERA